MCRPLRSTRPSIDPEKTRDERGYLDATYDAALTPDLRLLGRAAYDRYTYGGDYPFDDWSAAHPRSC